MDKKPLMTLVLFLLFNRPELTQKVFQEIKKRSRNSYLFLRMDHDYIMQLMLNIAGQSGIFLNKLIAI